MKKVSQLILTTLLFSLIAGCGYTQKVVLPGGIRTIYVETFKNAIPAERIFAYRSGLEIDLTNAVIKRFNFDGNVRIVKDKSKADAKLVGAIISYDQEAIRYTTLDRPQELRLHLVVDVKLINLKTGELMWHEANFSGSTLFEPNDEQGLRRVSAASDAVQDLARNIVDRTVEDW
ncbi:MAG: LptE family protein [Candidatus Omnitrophica bacterium]|nr:LptE family protein [Candidatus Omnitrophota bacterium]